MSWIRRMAVIVSLLTLALLVPEGVARIFLPQWKPPASDRPSLFVHHRELGWTHPPSTSMDHYGGFIASNRLGLRDPEPGQKTKPRVLFLGDSFTWGWGIGKNSDRYVDRLQVNFSAYEFNNAGVVSFNTVQEYLLLMQYRDVFQPDYIVLQVFQNDFQENLVGEGIYPRPHLDLAKRGEIVNFPSLDPNHSGWRSLLVWVGENSYFYRQLLIHLFTALLRSGVSLEKERIEHTVEQQQQAMALGLKKIIALAQEEQWPLLVIYSGLNQQEAHTVQSTCETSGVRAINLDPAFDGATEQWKDYTQHWTIYGHQRVADYLQPQLRMFLAGVPRRD